MGINYQPQLVGCRISQAIRPEGLKAWDGSTADKDRGDLGSDDLDSEFPGGVVVVNHGVVKHQRMLEEKGQGSLYSLYLDLRIDM